MFTYILRRIISSIPVLFGILAVTFILARAIPGDPCRAMLGEKATQAVCDEFIHRHGLDKPILTQFAIYVGEIARGDFGVSLRYGRPVTEMMIERVPTTLELAISAMIFATVFGIPLGIISAVRQNSAVDIGTMMVANIGISMPVFWLGLMLAYVFALLLKGTPFQLPPSGRLSPGMSPDPFYVALGLHVTSKGLLSVLEFISRLNMVNAILMWRWDVFWDALKHMILPAIAVGTIPLALIARMTRSSMLDVLGTDYIRAARAKGVSRYSQIMNHALRNALLPLVTIIGLSLGALLGGAVLTETIFNLSGVGKILYDAITARDYIIVQSFTVVIAVFFVVLNLIVDISYIYLDPACPAGVTRMGEVINNTPIGKVETVNREKLRTEKPVSLWGTARRRFIKRKSAILGMVILGILLFIAIFAPLLAPYNPQQVLIGVEDVKARQAPCIHLLGCPADQPQHIMGIDGNVRDEFSRVIYGARLSLIIGFTTVTFAIIIGTTIGALAGYLGGWTDNVLMRFMDVLLAFPSLLLAIAIVTILGPGLINALLAIGIVSIPAYARVTRSAILTTREMDFVTASRSLGASTYYLLFKRILPNSLTPLIVIGTLGIATAILDAAALSFLGLGAQPPTPEWGSMLSAERNQVFTAPYLVFYPGLFIILVVISFNLIGDGLRDALDPRLAMKTK